jgi:hypothetical protein
MKSPKNTFFALKVPRQVAKKGRKFAKSFPVCLLYISSNFITVILHFIIKFILRFIYSSNYSFTWWILLFFHLYHLTPLSPNILIHPFFSKALSRIRTFFPLSVFYFVLLYSIVFFFSNNFSGVRSAYGSDDNIRPIRIGRCWAHSLVVFPIRQQL